MIRRYVTPTSPTHVALATLLCCTGAAALPGMVQADVFPRAHLAIDGLALRLGEAQDSVAADRSDDIDATGLRLRAGIEFAHPGYGLAALGRHPRSRSRAPRERDEPRSERHRERAPPRLRGPRLGLEMHAAFTRANHASIHDKTNVSLLGGYLTGRVPLGRVLSLKGLAGLASIGIDRAEEVEQSNTRQTGFGYGVGLEASLGRYTDLSVDWMRYLADAAPSDEGVERVNALGVGLKVRF